MECPDNEQHVLPAFLLTFEGERSLTTDWPLSELRCSSLKRSTLLISDHAEGSASGEQDEETPGDKESDGTPGEHMDMALDDNDEDGMDDNDEDGMDNNDEDRMDVDKPVRRKLRPRKKRIVEAGKSFAAAGRAQFIGYIQVVRGALRG